MQKQVENFLRSKRGYLKKSKIEIARILNLEINDFTLKVITDAIKKVSGELNNYNNKNKQVDITKKKEEFIEYVDNSKDQIAIDAIKYYLKHKDFENAKVIIDSLNVQYKERVLVIGDIHEPFSKEGYLEFCKEQYKAFNCTKVIFIGDIIDNCYSSFHNSDPDGYAAGEELDRAIDAIGKWYNAFPDAIVIIGNHDRLAYRKAFSGGVSKRWIRGYGDILNTPNWKFEESVVIDDVLYIHGEAGTARTKCKDVGMSVVQGHLHSQAYVEYINNRNFAMQVGTGVNDKLYAFNYNKAGKESIISCGVVLEGKQAILVKY